MPMGAAVVSCKDDFDVLGDARTVSSRSDDFDPFVDGSAMLVG